MVEKNLPPAILRIDDLYKIYGTKCVLDNIDLVVRQGEFCSVVGPSGCGKSTLLRLILGEEWPTAGSVLIDGHPCGFPDTKRGIVDQTYSLYPHMTVLQNVMASARFRAGIWWSREKKERACNDAIYFLTRVNLRNDHDKYPYQLSGGMKQRVAIAQALVSKPRIVLMDEPFGALDPATREDAQLFLLELWEEFGLTVFFVTHDMEEAVFLGTRIIALSQFYIDDRGHEFTHRGAKIVEDHSLGRELVSTREKTRLEFRELIEHMRLKAFDKAHFQHVREFNLKHPDSFRTLTAEENGG